MKTLYERPHDPHDVDTKVCLYVEVDANSVATDVSKPFVIMSIWVNLVSPARGSKTGRLHEFSRTCVYIKKAAEGI